MSFLIFLLTMSHNRFDAFTLALHFADNTANFPADDQLWKLRPVINVLDKTFSSLITPNKTILLDESFWAFMVSHQALQYVPKEKAPRGLKVYKLCSSDIPEASYTTACWIYTWQDQGKLPMSMKAVEDFFEKGSLMDKTPLSRTMCQRTHPSTGGGSMPGDKDPLQDLQGLPVPIHLLQPRCSPR